MTIITALLDYLAWLLIRLTMTNAYKQSVSVLQRVLS